MTREPKIAFPLTACLFLAIGSLSSFHLPAKGEASPDPRHLAGFGDVDQTDGRTVVVGGDHNYPPFEFLAENGEPKGFAVDVTRAVTRAMGVDATIRLGVWSEVLEGLKSGDIDVVQGIFYSPQRAREFSFSQPYFRSHYVAVVRQGGGPPPDTLAELAGKTIIAQRGDFILDALKAQGIEARITLVDSHEDILRRLRSGPFDCGLAARSAALYLIEKNDWDDLRLGDHSLFYGEYCFAVARGREALLATFGEGLEAITRNGEYRRIHNQWMGAYEASPVSFWTVFQHAAYIVVPLLAILALALIWNRELRRQVAQRTAELHASVEFQRATIACSPVALYCVDMDGVVISWNSSAERIFGWRAEEAIGRPLPIVPPDKREEFAALRRQILEGEEIFDRDLIRLRKGGDRFHMRLSAVAMRDDTGNLIGILGVAEDISSRKRDEQRIQHLNQVLRAIRDVNQLIVRESDVQRLIETVCHILVDSRGYSGVWTILVDEQGRATQYAQVNMDTDMLAECVRKNLPPPCCREVDAEHPLQVIDPPRTCEGCPAAAECRGKGLWCGCLRHEERIFGYLSVRGDRAFVDDEEEKSLFLEMIDDLGYALNALAARAARDRVEAEWHSMQRQLLHAQKMDSVGRLAGGVAHDFNNLLMGIQNLAEMCKAKVEEDGELGGWLDEILTTTRRSTTLTRQLLVFARKQTVAPHVLDLNESVAPMLNLIRRLIGEDIDLIWLPGENLPSVTMDPGQLDQVLTNVCVNARDAIHGVGKITIETTAVDIDADYCAEHVEALPGRFIMLAVADDGCGMEDATLEQIFEPFFTTKQPGEGTGLGLSTVYGIVRQNHGFVNVYSEPGHGTIFRLYFPACKKVSETAAADSPPPPASEAKPGAGRKILLVEDEPTIRSTLAQFLELQGYAVSSTESPEEALTMAEQSVTPFQLLITDVVMPGMNGRELASRLESTMPEMKCLFISGYTANAIAHRGILDKGIDFLSKPFTCAELMHKIDTMFSA